MTAPTFSYSTLLVTEPREGVIVCTFNQPEVRNALGIEMVGEIRDLLGRLSERDDLGALIFTGGEKSFVSGANIAELRDRRAAAALAQINSSLFREIELFPAPTIAAIRGYALGGGCELAMACDIRLCGEGARLGQPEVSLGIIPGAGATYRLPRLVGPGLARELIFTGRIIDGHTAHTIGLVNRVVEDDEVRSTAIALGVEISQNSSLAVRLAKSALNTAVESGTEACMAFESTAQALLFEDDEKMRRMTNFLEKRQTPKAVKASRA